MAWRHGYGKMSSHYWDRVQKGLKESTELEEGIKDWAKRLAAAGIIVGAVIPSKKDDAMYTIVSENGTEYYSNEFRIYGKGITFTDVYGKTVIIQGDIEIVKNNQNK